uniref:Uncharacterized protein n=1 Tax=Anguilla anguilla TaxID=7936 RepID=A0A0E9X8B4_ANGAN
MFCAMLKHTFEMYIPLQSSWLCQNMASVPSHSNSDGSVLRKGKEYVR